MMDQAVFDRLCEIIYAQSGIRIKDGKKGMLAARIRKRLKALSLPDEVSYLKHLQRHLDQEIVYLLDSVSTNVTHFFRESEHFDYIRERMTEWLAAGQTRFRFWSAASSTGQEPYSLAMTLLDVCAEHGRKPDIKILATDISTRVLKEAEAGVYDEEKIVGIPDEQRSRHFDTIQDGGKTVYRAKPMLREMIVYKRLNLSQPPFPMRGPMDVILCRNVMIYFDDPVCRALVKDFHRLIGTAGYLIVGMSENLLNSTDLMGRAGRSVYRRKTSTKSGVGVS